MSEVIGNEEVVKEEPVSRAELDAIMAQVKKMEDSNSRLLEESKSYKSKYQGLKSENENKEKSELASNEQWKELDEINKNEIHSLNERLKVSEKKALKKDLNFQVAALAKDAHDVSDIINALPQDLLSLDADNQSVGGIEEAVNAVRANKPWMFNTEKKSGQTSLRPAMDTSPEPDLRSSEDKLADVLGDFVL